MTDVSSTTGPAQAAQPAASVRFSGFGGLALVADAYGSADNPAIVLLHDAGRTRRAWGAAARSLVGAGRYVLALDLRGHGDSDRAADGRYDLDAHAHDLRAALGQLPTRPVVVGAGLGGLIALAALAEGGESLASGLVLVDAEPDAEAPGRAADAAFAGESAKVEAAAAQLALPVLCLQRGPIRRDSVLARLCGLAPGAESVELDPAGDRIEAFNASLIEFLERRAPREPIGFEAGADPRTLRDALGCFGTGVVIACALGPDGAPVGLTANSFTSVSLDPPLILFCIAKDASTRAAFDAARSFSVNVLHIGQQPTSQRFARRGEDRFEGTAWETWDTGAPIISGSLASIECDREALYEAGDHVIHIGRVRRARFEPRRDPLLYFRGRYRRLHLV